VQSRTGTGKTAAFGIPMIEKVDPALAAVQAVALAPTRELAIQVAEELTQIGKGKGVRIETIYGGDSMDRQLRGSAPEPASSWARPARLDHLRRATAL
jgi:ATP-dependent RNA helicase DeaD